MTPGYEDDLYSEPSQRSRRLRPGQEGRRGFESSSHESYMDSLPPPPPVPPPPPPKVNGTRRRPRDDWSRQRGRRRDYDYRNQPHRGSRRMRPSPPPREYYPPYPIPGSEPRSDYDHYQRPRERVREPVREPEPHLRDSAPRPPSTSSSGSSRGILIGAFVIFLLLLLFMFRGPIMDFIENPPPLRYREYPEGIDFTVRKSMTLEVNSGRQGAHISYKLKSACPKDSTIDNFYLQDVKDVKIQPEPSTGFPDIRDKTQEIMLWEEDFFYGSKTFILEYTIRTRFFQWDLDEGDSGNIRDIPDTLKQRYNHDEWRLDKDGDGELDDEDDQDGDGEWDYLIEVTNPDIQSRAKDLANGETNVFKIVRNIYDYLTQDGVLNYVTTSTGLPKDCATTYSDKRGDCDDYSILFISLCRALDIPAWLELGVLYDKQNRQWGGHAWSKVAIPLKGGGYAAPSIDIVNKQFMLFDPYRFIEWRDTGGDELYPGETETRNNLDYYYHTFSYQSTGSPQIVSPNTNDFLTLSMNEFGDKKRVAADDDEGLGSLCMLPGFDSSVFVISFIFATLIIAVNKSKIRRKRYL